LKLEILGTPLTVSTNVMLKKKIVEYSLHRFPRVAFRGAPLLHRAVKGNKRVKVPTHSGGGLFDNISLPGVPGHSKWGYGEREILSGGGAPNGGHLQKSLDKKKRCLCCHKCCEKMNFGGGAHMVNCISLENRAKVDSATIGLALNHWGETGGICGGAAPPWRIFQLKVQKRIYQWDPILLKI